MPLLHELMGYNNKAYFSLPGGTDIISCFAGQNPTVPVYRGEIQSRNLGMAMHCWNDEGTYGRVEYHSRTSLSGPSI